MKRIGAAGLLFTVWIASEGHPPAAQEEHKDRPRIGLVLGGGGARGAAHIGVLKVLEENRIPVHYIAGTSMGALVGGAYASGLSPDELHRLIGEIDWKRAMADEPPRADLSIRDKLNRRKYIPLEFGLRGGKVLMPQGAIQGQNLEHILQTMTLHVADVQDFDQLPIPFRAVATDLETGEELDLKQGNLADALRASMAVPGAFSPIVLEGRLLADGYIVKNLPVDVAQAMGADVLIVVDVGSALPTRDELDSFLKASGQAGNIMARQNVQKQLQKMKPADILIHPDLGSMTTASFDRCVEGVAAGEKAARAMVEKLRRYSVSEAEYSAFLKKQRRMETPSPTIEFVRVEGSTRVSQETIMARVQVRVGEPLDLDRVSADITRIQSLGAFEKVGFRIEEVDGRRGIVYTTEDKSWGPDYLRAGINLATNFRGDSVYNIMVDYRMTEINDLGAEWEWEAQIGRTERLGTEFYQPLEISRTVFVAPSLEWRQDTADIYTDGQRVAEYLTRRVEGGVDVGLSLDSLAELRVGPYRGLVRAETSTGSAGLPKLTADRGGVRIQATFDQMDDVYFPKNGVYAKSVAWLEMESLGAESSYEKISSAVWAAKTFGKHTFLIGGGCGLNPGDDAPFYDEFTLGGFLHLSGLRNQELRGRQAANLEAIYYYKIADQLTSLVQEVYAGGSIEGGNTWNDLSDMHLSDFAWGGSIFVGVRSLLGPVYLALGKNEKGGRAEIYLYMGQIF